MSEKASKSQEEEPDDAGSRDSGLLLAEKRHLEELLLQREEDVRIVREKVEKMKELNDYLSRENKEMDKEILKIRTESDKLLQDTVDCKAQMSSQTESFTLAISEKEKEIASYKGEILNLLDANVELGRQNREMANLCQETMAEMEEMREESESMQRFLQDCNSRSDTLRRRNEDYEVKADRLRRQITEKEKWADPVRTAIHLKTEEWKMVTETKHEQFEKYSHMVKDLREKLEMAGDRTNVLSLQQALQEKDQEIAKLTLENEKCIKEMQHNAQAMEVSEENEKGGTSEHQDQIKELQLRITKVKMQLKKAVRDADDKQNEALLKERDLVMVRERIRRYELKRDKKCCTKGWCQRQKEGCNEHKDQKKRKTVMQRLSNLFFCCI